MTDLNAPGKLGMRFRSSRTAIYRGGDHRVAVLFVSLLMLLSVAFSSSSAYATTTNISGSQSIGVVIAYNTKRTDTVSKPLHSFEELQANAPAYIALRRSSGKTYARAEGVYNKYVSIKDDSGTLYTAPGDFYINFEQDGGCGGDCGSVDWNGKLQYNIQYGN